MSSTASLTPHTKNTKHPPLDAETPRLHNTHNTDTHNNNNDNCDNHDNTDNTDNDNNTNNSTPHTQPPPPSSSHHHHEEMKRFRVGPAVHGGFKDAWVEGGLAEDVVAGVGLLIARNPDIKIYCTGIFCVWW